MPLLHVSQAERSGLTGEAIYKSLSADSDPQPTTLLSVLKKMGLRLSVAMDEEAVARFVKCAIARSAIET